MRVGTTSKWAFFLLVLVQACTPRHSTLVAYDRAEELKNSLLLVPLPSAEQQAQRFEKYGEQRKAQKLRKKFQEPNLRLMQAFRDHFSYCPVRFYFYPFDSSRHFRGDRGLMDASGQWVSFEEGSNFFYATVDERVENQGERDEEFTVLVIRNRDFVPLSTPFPGETRVQSYPSQNSLNAVVRRLEQKLLDLDAKGEEARKD